MIFPRLPKQCLVALLLTALVVSLTPSAWADSFVRKTRRRTVDADRNESRSPWGPKTTPGRTGRRADASLAATMARTIEKVLSGQEVDEGSLVLGEAATAEIEELGSRLETEFEETRDFQERLECLRDILQESDLLSDIFSEIDPGVLADIPANEMFDAQALLDEIDAIMDHFKQDALGIGPAGAAIAAAVTWIALEVGSHYVGKALDKIDENTWDQPETPPAPDENPDNPEGEGEGDGDGDGGGVDPEKDENGMIVPPDWDQWPPSLLDSLRQDFNRYDLLNGRSPALDLALTTTQPRHFEVGAPAVISRGPGRDGTGSISRELGPVVREVDPQVSSVIDGKVSRVSPRVISNPSLIDRRSGTITLLDRARVDRRQRSTIRPRSRRFNR